MTPHAIAVALFAAFVVGGILAKAVPLWLVAVLGLAIGAAVFVFVDRYPRLPRSRQRPTQALLAGGGRVLVVPELEAISAPPDPAAPAGGATGTLQRMTDR